MDNSITEDVLSIISRQVEILKNIDDSLQNRLPQWRDRTLRFLRNKVIEDELRILAKIDGKDWPDEKKLYLQYIRELENGIKEIPEQYLITEVLPDKPESSNTNGGNHTAIKSNRVFVVHGHDSLAKTEVARALEKLGLEAIILHEQPNEGKTVIEKFERDASQVSFAVVLLTPDDIGYPNNKPGTKKSRARQNVILELGYFCGILGRSNVCVLFKGDIEIPSDYLGVVYVDMDDGGAWRFNLAKELKQSGMSVDLNNLV